MQAKRRSYLTRVLGFLALLLALNAVSLTGWNIPGLGVKLAEAGGDCVYQICVGSTQESCNINLSAGVHCGRFCPACQ